MSGDFILNDIIESVKKHEPRIKRPQIWVFGTTFKENMIKSWCRCISWYRPISAIKIPVFTIYRKNENGETDMFYDKVGMQDYVTAVIEVMKNNQDLVMNECKRTRDSILQTALDLEKIKLENFPDEIVYKIYNIFLNQYVEIFKFENIPRSIEINDEVAALNEKFSIIKEYVDESLSKLDSAFEKIYNEIGRRVGRNVKDIQLMNPEEINYALHTTKVDEWSINERTKHFLIVYDLEKDDPLIYSGEKARVMEVSLNLKKLKEEKKQNK